LVALALLGTGCNQDKIARLEKQNNELKARLDAATKSANLDMQEKCAKQARIEFNRAGFDKDETANFTNHYNPKLNKCFVDIFSAKSHLTPYVPTAFRSVSDAFEGKGFGEYMWINNSGKKYWEVKPFVCKVTLLSGEEKYCESDKEFDELVKIYME
jgi:hypothetical protein